MKKLFLITCAVLLMVCNSFSQSIEKTDYLQKSRKQKTTAWVLLGSGAVITVIGFASFPKNYDVIFGSEEDDSKANTATWLVVIGSATMLSSIPFTIAGSINKKKALSVALNTQKLQQLKKSSMYTINYPAITLKIKL